MNKITKTELENNDILLMSNGKLVQVKLDYEILPKLRKDVLKTFNKNYEYYYLDNFSPRLTHAVREEIKVVGKVNNIDLITRELSTLSLSNLYSFINSIDYLTTLIINNSFNEIDNQMVLDGNIKRAEEKIRSLDRFIHLFYYCELKISNSFILKYLNKSLDELNSKEKELFVKEKLPNLITKNILVSYDTEKEEFIKINKNESKIIRNSAFKFNKYQTKEEADFIKNIFERTFILQ